MDNYTKEKRKEYNKKYRNANKEKIVLYYINNKEIIKKRTLERYYKIKHQKQYIKNNTSRKVWVAQERLKLQGDDNRYIDKETLLYHTILSKGMGKPNEILEYAFILLIDNFSKGWTWHDYEIMNDSKQRAYIDLHKGFHTVDIERDIFTYYTQIIKISFYQMINQWRFEKPTSQYKDFIKISFDSFEKQNYY